MLNVVKTDYKNQNTLSWQICSHTWEFEVSRNTGSKYIEHLSITAYFPHMAKKQPDFAPGTDAQRQWVLARGDLGTNRMKWSDKKKLRLEMRSMNIKYQLLLTWHKSLKTRGHTKSQLVNEGRFILVVDLNLYACFIGGLICGCSTPENVTPKYGNPSIPDITSRTDIKCW